MDICKGILAVVLAITILIGVSGCMKDSAKTKKKYTPEGIKDTMIAYLEEKYGEEFVPITLTPRNWAYDYDELSVYPKNGNEEEDYFYVRGTKMEDGSYIMQDGYFGVLIKDEYEAFMRSLVKEIYDEFKLYSMFGKLGVLPDRLNKDTKLSEIYDPNEYFSSSTNVFVKQLSAKGIDPKEAIRKIAEKMVENKLVGSIRIYIVFDDKYEDFDYDTFRNMPVTKEEEYYVSKIGRKVPYYVLDVTPELQIVKYGGDDE